LRRVRREDGLHETVGSGLARQLDELRLGNRVSFGGRLTRQDARSGVAPGWRCRLCGDEARLLGARPDIGLYRCATCAFVSGRPAQELGAEVRYGHYYRGELPPAPDARYIEWLTRAERDVGVGRLLEVGAGSGGFVRVALQRGWKVDAVEVAPAGAERMEQMGARVFRGDVSKAGYAEGQFDLVVSLEVLEHLPEPYPHLALLARLTRIEGRLLLTTPSFNGLSRRWLGMRWRVVDPEHLGYFTSRTLAGAARRAGYREVNVRSRGLDVTTWRRTAGSDRPAPFDPEASARLRDAVEGRRSLRLLKEGLNAVLGLTGLGDSLLMWARK
jgi:SAM-dependent methyltransferase